MGGKIVEKLKNISLQKHQGQFENSLSCTQQFFSYFSFYSLMLFLGTSPPPIQKIVVHFLQPIGISAIAYLLSEIVHHPWMSFIPILIVVGIFYRSICLERKKSLSRKSRVLNSEQTESEQVRYTQRTINTVRTFTETGTRVTTLQDPSLTTEDNNNDNNNLEVRPAQIVHHSLVPLQLISPSHSLREDSFIDETSSPDIADSCLYETPLADIFSDLEAFEGVEKESSYQPVPQLSKKLSSKSPSRRLYRGMFSLSDDDMTETSPSSFRQRRTTRRTRSEKSSPSLSQSSFSGILRLISFENSVVQKDNGNDDGDDDDDDFDSFSSGSRYSFGSDDSYDS